MSPSNASGVAVTRETLLFLAWIAGQANLSDLRVSHNEPQHMLPAQLTSCLPPLFELDAYGPVYQALFLHRLAQVEWTSVHRAIRGFDAVYLKDEASPADGEETAILWETVSKQTQILQELRRLREIWQQEPARLISHLRVHFQMRQPLLIRSVESAFLVQEFLAMSLARVDWRSIAAQVLMVPVETMPVAPTPEEEHSSWPQLQFALLREFLWQAERTLSDFGADLWASAQLRQLCLALADGCLYTRRDLAQLHKAGQVYAETTEKGEPC